MLDQFVQQALERARIRPSRARGQHFLIDDRVLAEILRAAELSQDDYIVEIGPGLGTLTTSLARRVRKVFAFELDEGLARYLRNWVLHDNPNIELDDIAFNKYVLEKVIERARADGAPLKIVTNLPYQISAAFLHTLVDYAEDIELSVVMLQKEVAQRVTARPGDPGYNSFSIYLQTWLSSRMVCDVPEYSFMPPPKVKSAVIRIRPLEDSEKPKPVNREIYFHLVENIFRQRRKQISNSLNFAFGHLSAEQVQQAITGAGLDPLMRAQDVSLEQYVILSDVLDSMGVMAKRKGREEEEE
ncbi:MAG: 16S rRNA (adenine(1518)-N(6)/adenine(1519)-N(6))-dimethyltransferase RsmA [bacterium]